MSSKTRRKTAKSKPKKTPKKEPTPAAVLKKVASVSDSTKTLSKEIKAMTKIFSENQKILVTMKNMIDSLTSALDHIQKQSRQINILEEDTQKLFFGLNQVKGQTNLVTKINDQTARLQDQITKLREVQKSPLETEKLSQKISQSMDSNKNNSQMIIKISQRIDEVRDNLRKFSTKTETSSSVTKELDGIRKKIESISGKAVQVESLSGVIEGLQQQFQQIYKKTDSLVKWADSSAMLGEGLKSVQSDFVDFKENVFNKTNTIEQKISGISDLVKRSEDSASEFHIKTDKVFQELQNIKNVTNKAASDTSKEMIALLKLSEFQSNIRMNTESKYGELQDLENMTSQTTQIINLFDKLSIESQEKIPVPHEVRQWAVSKILDCADKWEIRFSDVFNILTNNLGRDLLKESIRIKQVREIFGIRAVDEIRKDLNIS